MGASGANARGVLIGALTDAVRDGAAGGDLDVARVALEALRRLIGEGGAEGARGDVIELAARRREP